MSIPSQVTIQYLIKEYDTLVNKLNDNDVTTTTKASTQSFTIGQPSIIDSSAIITNTNENNNNNNTSEYDQHNENNIVLYENISVICCILLYIDTHITFSSLLTVRQRYQVCTTARRSFLLKKRLHEIFHSGSTSTYVNNDDSIMFLPQLEETVIVTIKHQNDNMKRCSDTIQDTYFEWRYNNTSNYLESNNDKSLVENMYHPIDLSFDKYELAKEEELLYTMANTPIPQDNTTISSIQYLIRSEWGT